MFAVLRGGCVRVVVGIIDDTASIFFIFYVCVFQAAVVTTHNFQSICLVTCFGPQPLSCRHAASMPSQPPNVSHMSTRFKWPTHTQFCRVQCANCELSSTALPATCDKAFSQSSIDIQSIDQNRTLQTEEVWKKKIGLEQ